MTSIDKLASSVSHKKLIPAQDAGKLVSLAEKDSKITGKETRAMERVAKLPDDRFEKVGGEVASAVDELRGSATWARDLLDCKVVTHGSVPGLTVSFDRAVTVEESEYGNSYHRFLNVQLAGKTAPKDGTLSFTYGDFKVSVRIKKGATAEHIFEQVERRVLRQQNGAMSVRGGVTSERVLRPSIGFGIHRTAPMTRLEKLEFDKRMIEADLWELQSEGAPDALTAPVIAAIKDLSEKIARLEKKG